MSNEAENNEQNWKPNAGKWLITCAVMLATFVDALNSSIANVALKDISGSFSISQDESLWIVTSFFVACSVILPATAWFSTVIGRKKFFLICVVGFGLASLLCGLAPNIEIMLLARVLQGMFGGPLFPISQAILLETFPKRQHGQAMAIFSLGVVLAPVIGPILGGYLTTNYSWSWVFYISVPFCVIAAVLVKMYVEDPPYMRAQGLQKIDYIGFILLVIWLASFQVMLDNGQKNSWFESEKICRYGIISLISFIALIWWELKNKEPLFDLRIFLNWNFTIGTLIYSLIFGILFGSMAMLPQFLQGLMGYSSFLSGLAIGPLGIGSFIGIMIAGALSTVFDLKKQVLVGFVGLSLACIMFSGLNLNISLQNVVIPNILFGASMPFVLVPLTTLIFAFVSNEGMTNASGLQNLLKNVGSAVGTSMVGVMISRYSQIHQHYLVDNMTPLNPVFEAKYNALVSAFSGHTDTITAQIKANAMLYNQLIQQSTLSAFMSAYKTYAIVILLALPFVFLIKRVKYD